MNFKAILFDLDDTIHDREKSLHKFIDLFRQKFYPTMNPERYLSFKDAFLEVDCRGYKAREQVFNELQERLFGEFKTNIGLLKGKAPLLLVGACKESLDIHKISL